MSNRRAFGRYCEPSYGLNNQKSLDRFIPLNTEFAEKQNHPDYHRNTIENRKELDLNMISLVRYLLLIILIMQNTLAIELSNLPFI